MDFCGSEVYTWHWSIASISTGLNSRRSKREVAFSKGPTVAVGRNEEVLVLVQGETDETDKDMCSCEDSRSKTDTRFSKGNTIEEA